MTMGMIVQNPNNQGFLLKSFFGELYANNYLIGNVSLKTPVELPAGQQTIVYLEGRMLLLGIVTDILNGIRTGVWKQTIEMVSTANVDNTVIPVDIDYKLA